MLNMISEPMQILRLNEPRDFKGRDGDNHTCYSFMVLDDIYPVRVLCTPDVYNMLREGEFYQFRFALNYFKGTYKVRAVEVV